MYTILLHQSIVKTMVTTSKQKDDMKITYKIITPSELWIYELSLLDLIDPNNLRPDNILKSLENSNIIVLALDWKKVIWSNQIITDMYFSALLINLVVKPQYRKLWIGAKIIQKTLEELVELKIKNIQLVADPWSSWLNKFYSKYWFRKWDKRWTYLYFDKENLM